MDAEQPSSKPAGLVTASETDGPHTTGVIDERRWRRWWHSCLVLLAMAALVLAGLGYLDLVDAPGVAARLTGLALLIVGLLSFLAVVVDWRSERRSDSPPQSYPSGLGVRGGVVAAVALLLVSSWIINTVIPPRQPHLTTVLIVAIVVAVVAVVTLLLAWLVQQPRQSPRPGAAAAATESGTDLDKSRADPHRAAWIGASATVAAALIALPLAWYSVLYLPAHAPPGVSVETEVTDVARHGDQAAATISIKVENTGSTSVRIIGSLYTISGSTVAAVDPSGSALEWSKVEAATRANYGPGARANAQTWLSPPSLIQFGQVVWDQATLVPKESTEVSIVVFFPVGQFDVLRLGSDLVTAREDRLPIAQPPPAGAPGDTASCGDKEVHVRTWPIEPGSVFERLTVPRQEAVIARVLYDAESDGSWWPAAPYLLHQVQHEENSCEHLFAEDGGGLEDESMVGVVGAMTEQLIPSELASSLR